jgi:hypothetical protein
MNGDRSRGDLHIGAVAVTATRNAGRQRLNAALIDAARTLDAARASNGAPAAEFVAIFDRCADLLQRAGEAAARSPLLAHDCLYQLERELVATMDESQRDAALAIYRAEGNAIADRWRREATLELASEGSEAPSVAMLQALMRVVHGARLHEKCRLEQGRRQIMALAVLLIAAVVFFSGWALVGGFEWVQHDDVEVTLAMMLVNGVLFGFLGGLLSVVFGLPQRAAGEQAAELSGGWVSIIARPFVGAAVAIPIAFFLQSGLLNLGNVTPAFDLALCFAGGFFERWFSVQLDRMAGRREG